jgi:hypothetical protein
MKMNKFAPDPKVADGVDDDDAERKNGSRGGKEGTVVAYLRGTSARICLVRLLAGLLRTS